MNSQILWMVAHYDIHGTGGIVRDHLAEPEAQALCEEFDRKGHHQTYVALPYTEETKAAVLERETILP